MTTTSDAATLIRRLRMLADEFESADRFGIPIPPCVSIDGHSHGDAGFAATAEEFSAWLDYFIGCEVTEYDHDGKHWRRLEGDCNGLPLRISTSTPTVEAVSA